MLEVKHLIRKCAADNLYTLRLECPRCGKPTFDAHPPKYSPDDKYARYRISDRYSEEEPRQEL